MKRIAVLLLLGIVLAGPEAFIANPCCEEEEPEGGCARITMMLTKRQDLGLTAAQIEKIRSVRTGLLRENGLRVAHLNIMRPDLKNLMDTPYPDMPALKDLLKRVSELELQVHLRKMDALNQAYALLNGDQQARYAELWKKHQQTQKRTKK